MESVYYNPIRKKTSIVQDITSSSLEAFLGRKDFGFSSLDFIILEVVFSEIANVSKSKSVLFGEKIHPRPCPLPSPCAYLTKVEGIQYNKLLRRL